MKLIVGLGNPEQKYMKTRHNAGFMVLENIISKRGLKLREKFKSFFVKDGDFLFMLPATYMNLSGKAVIEAYNFFKLDIKDILIIYDDISLPLGTLRFRPDGSDGGHNGIKSIIRELGSKNFDRLKFGIGPQPGGMPSERFVLENFQDAEQDNLTITIQAASNAALDWLNFDMPKLQNLYNKSHI